MGLRFIAGGIALFALALGCSAPAPPPAPQSGGVVGEAPAIPTPLRTEALPAPLRSVSSPRFSYRAARRQPPPISGGTLLVLRDDRTAVASDPDLDVVWIVDLPGDVAPRRVALSHGDEPGRAVEDASGRVHVALRRGGAVLTLDVASATITARRSVCAAPRGIAWDGARLHVACAGGEFVSLGAEGDARETLRLEPDLRDVLVRGDALYVTQFRSAKVFEVRGDAVRPLGAPTPYRQPDGARRSPSVAWRAINFDGDVVMLHQSMLEVIDPPTRSTGYYGATSSPNAIARLPSITRITALDGLDETPAWTDGVPMLEAGFAVDVAARSDAQGKRSIAVASPGWAFSETTPQVSVTQLDGRSVSRRVGVRVPTGQAVAVAWTRAGALVVQTRASGALLVVDDTAVDSVRAINLYADDDEFDPEVGEHVGEIGHDVFHAATAAGIACASCHPEGGDDGRVWNFLGIGRRRTPSLRGGVMQTAPFHWDGDLRDLDALMSEVFVRRMGGPSVTAVTRDRLGIWLDTIPAVRASPAVDPSAVTRGEALFNAADVGCAECHAGAAFTNNESVGVGTGGNFQVAPLTGLWLRAPYMHDGRASSLRTRFTDPTAGGDLHGRTSQLTPAQREDLVAFLATL